MKMASLTWHLARISNDPTAKSTPTLMFGCTNVFPFEEPEHKIKWLICGMHLRLLDVSVF
jgi:hypothetical protein